jgi:hypothetical protein
VKLWQTALSGALALALLEAATSTTQAAGRVGSLLTALDNVVQRVLSPTVAAIPDLRTKSAAAPSDDDTTGSSTTVTASPASASTTPEWTTSPPTPTTPTATYV